MGERRSGNTTRIIDEAIQALFNHGAVIVKDHFDTGKNNKALIHKIVRRITMEHPNTPLNVDFTKFSISFGESTKLDSGLGHSDIYDDDGN